MSAAAGMLACAGRYDTVDALLDRIDAAIVDPAAIDPQALGERYQARALRALSAGNLGAALGAMEGAIAAFERAGDLRSGCTGQGNLSAILLELGGFDEAESVLRAALTEAENLGLTEVTAGVLGSLGYALLHTGHPRRSTDHSRERAVAACQRHGDGRGEGASRTYLARIHLAAGDPASSEQRVAPRVGPAPQGRPRCAHMRWRCARAPLSACGRAVEAIAAAEEAFALLQAAGGSLEEGEALVRLVHVEALFAAGRLAEAHAALALARGAASSRAPRPSATPAWRNASFLSRVPGQRRWTLAGSRRAQEGTTGSSAASPVVQPGPSPPRRRQGPRQAAGEEGRVGARGREVVDDYGCARPSACRGPGARRRPLPSSPTR